MLGGVFDFLDTNVSARGLDMAEGAMGYLSAEGSGKDNAWLRSTPDCLGPDDIVGLVEGQLAGEELARAHAHLGQCAPCRRHVSDLIKASRESGPRSTGCPQKSPPTSFLEERPSADTSSTAGSAKAPWASFTWAIIVDYVPRVGVNSQAAFDTFCAAAGTRRPRRLSVSTAGQ